MSDFTYMAFLIVLEIAFWVVMAGTAFCFVAAGAAFAEHLRRILHR